MKLVLFYLLYISFANSQILNKPKNTPLYWLGQTNKVEEKKVFSVKFDTAWVDSLSLLLPCEGIPVPKRTSRLPNAPRKYRSGTHRGVDFFANWGTPIRAVSEGTVIRADHNYQEYPAEYRVELLKSSARVGHTPSDIFNSVLLGKSVFLDHGFDLVPGFRAISIYAHLSSIESNLKPGELIKAGQLIGKSGNTGTRASTLNTKKEAHLHWEMILQKGKEEIYLGQGVPNPQLYKLLYRIFQLK